MDLEVIKKFLKSYDGEEITLMEVCGTHTAAISENGIPSLLSKKIKLVSGPGCPVCVTVAKYIDRLCELSLKQGNCVVTFGDLMRVPGSVSSLQEAKALGGNVKMVYSPFEILDMAKSKPDTEFIFAAVGFETTTPIYSVIIDKAIKENISNIKLLTALKTMPQAINKICSMPHKIDGFLAPGNVSVITGADEFKPLAEKYKIPFAVSGFNAEELLASIYALVKLKNQGRVINLYKYAVTDNGNKNAKQLVSKYFEPYDACWRGLGTIPHSGMILKSEFQKFDAGSINIREDKLKNGCKCAEVITGFTSPTECPLFKVKCTPEDPQGACMVSMEGSCFHYYVNNRG